MKTYKINNYITKYCINYPIDTQSTILDSSTEINTDFKYLDIIVDDTITLNLKLETTDKIYGLGQNLRGINKRGFQYHSFCTDDPCHTPDKTSLYGAHNFIIIDNKKSFGIFIDYPSLITYDLGYTTSDELIININGNNANIFIIEGQDKTTIVSNFLQLIGKPYLPPKWSFGYIQSRWSYPNISSIENLVSIFKQEDLPLEGVCLDIDYMDDYKDFTIDNVNFFNFKDFIQQMNEENIKIIPIIDAGIKIEKDYEIYEEGLKNNYYITNKDNSPFVGAVWPGKVCFPDFLNPQAANWFGKKYQKLIDLGCEGFWNDMNEPAIFYSEKNINEAFDTIQRLQKSTLNVDNFFKLKDTILSLSNSLDDYKSMYHHTIQGVINHYDIHNMYGYMMSKSASDGFKTINPDKRYLIFTRASMIGAHRYAGIWTGDN
ncbi:MAG: TIM-barrel domain-containing protein, partial [Erysipelotrichaceae bacterium]